MSPDSLSSERRLPVVHAAAGFVVVNKPAGLLSVPGKGEEHQDCVASRVRAMYPGATGPLTVHRLDMDTSGLIVVALDSESHRALSRQFESREVEKRYIAVVAGVVAGESGTIDVPLRPDLTNRPYQVVDPEHNREAVTAWRVLEREQDRTRLELVPHTGRTHQLRVHCAHAAPVGLGHPILGDVLYGPQPSTGNAAERLLLHASELLLTDPQTGERVRVAAPAEF